MGLPKRYIVTTLGETEAMGPPSDLNTSGEYKPRFKYKTRGKLKSGIDELIMDFVTEEIQDSFTVRDLQYFLKESPTAIGRSLSRLEKNRFIVEVELSTVN